MLKRVRQDWIEGVLEQSLYNVVRLELGLESRPQAVDHPLNAIVQRADQAPIPLNTNITNIFINDCGEAMLILGAPGAGKTTLLLELARDLLDRAAQDNNYPIPVVFNLSSWTRRRGRLDRWTIDELNLRNDVPKPLAQRWVENGQYPRRQPPYRQHCALFISNGGSG